MILTCLTRFLADSRWLSDQKLYLAWARSDAKEGTPNEQVGIKMMGRWSQASWHPGRPVSPGAEELTAAGLGCGLRLGLPPSPRLWYHMLAFHGWGGAVGALTTESEYKMRRAGRGAPEGLFPGRCSPSSVWSLPGDARPFLMQGGSQLGFELCSHLRASENHPLGPRCWLNESGL